MRPNWADVSVGETPADVADTVARAFVQLLESRDVERPFHVNLTGGSMGARVFARVKELLQAAEAPLAWPNVHFWWSDERFVEANSAERNEVAFVELLLEHILAHGPNVHLAPTSDSGFLLDDAAEIYAAHLRTFGNDQQPWPAFDVTFLGVGPDGHIASLFPGRPELAITDEAVVAVRNSPKPPPERISMTFPVLNTSQRVWFVATGADKAPALREGFTDESIELTPFVGVRGTAETTFFLDAALAEAIG